MNFFAKQSLTFKCLSIFIALFALLLLVVILFQARQNQHALENQNRRNVESLFAFTADVLAVNPELFRSDGLQDIIRRFAKNGSGFGRISIVDHNLIVIADSERAAIGQTSEFEGPATVLQTGRAGHIHPGPNSGDGSHDSVGTHEDSRAIFGAYDPVRKSNVIGVMTISYQVTPPFFNVTPALFWFMLLVSFSVVICGLVVWYALWRLLVRPMNQLMVGIQRFGTGGLSYRLDMDVDGAFGDMTRAINDMADNLEQGQRDSETSQAHIRNNEILLRSIIDQMPALVSLKDLQGRYLMANKGFETIIGTRREDVIGKTSFEIGLDKAAAQSITLQDRRVLETGVAQFEERKFETESGSYFRNGVKFPVFDANGVMTGIGTVSVDIAERKAIEDQLRQAQKMEVVGQLTGGVAHDFNNLLGVIIGNLDFLGEEIDGNKDQEEYVAIATRASLQAAELTNRLLAFSRRQALSPKIVDLNALIHGMTDLLERTLGETISIRAILPADLKLVLVDASQLETALLNLAVNALHAMPGGGLLTIETCNTELDREYTERHDEVAAGDYVMMAISDTGVGMSSDVLDQVFEPFFTTKDVGEGSGLGLSMVFGFLKQSGGHISIYSEEGEGTTVKLYFPVSKVDTQPSIADSEPAAIPLGSGETVLIVEDNLDLLNMAVKCVSSLGYKTLTALNAQEALTVFGDGAGIDVLFTDVVLPGGVNGVALAKAALERRPTLRVLYTSGYTENAIVHNGVIDDDIVLVEKPYRRETLSYRLREILGGN